MKAATRRTKEDLDLGLAVLCAIVEPGQGLSCQQISDMLDGAVTPQRISQIEHGARKKLRRLLRHLPEVRETFAFVN